MHEIQSKYISSKANSLIKLALNKEEYGFLL